MRYDYNLIVIGAGSAGLLTAAGASAIGAKVALVEGSKMGGDCLNTGCVPSKSFLSSAHLVDDINRSNELGLNKPDFTVDLENIMKRVSTVIKEIEPHDSVERFESLGIDVYQSYGEFVDEHTIAVDDKHITGKSIVISTGSSPLVPPIEGLREVQYFTNENIFTLNKLPKHLVVLGAGPIGMELGQGFKHLGSEVTLIDMADKIFPKDDSEVAPLMIEVFKNDRINLKLSSSIMSVMQEGEKILVTIEKDGIKEIIRGDCLLVSLGRRANISALKLENIGIELTNKGYIKTNGKLQSNKRNIYACGDVVGPYQFTHMAGYQAAIVIQNSIFPLKKSVQYKAVPWTTYTKPEVAHVGYTEEGAKKDGVFSNKYIVPLDSIDRAITDNDLSGFLKLIINKKNVVIGATLVGNKAGEQIALATLAITQKLKLKVYLSMIFSYPTEVEIYKSVALMSLQDSFKPWHKKLIQKLFL